MNPHDQNHLELGGRAALLMMGSWAEFRKFFGIPEPVDFWEQQ